MSETAPSDPPGRQSANKGRVERLLDLFALPDHDRSLPDHFQDKALVCMVDADVRRILSFILERGSATDHELWRFVLRDRERLSLRLYRLLLYRLVTVVDRDPDRYVVEKATLARLTGSLAAAFRLSASDLFDRS
jgi:hypothetical protein